MTRTSAATSSGALAAAVTAIGVAAFAVHAARAFPVAYFNHVTGVWLTLADDLLHGTFYRELSSGPGYGGTRYFPLFFAIIGGFMRAGASPVAAAWLAAGLSAISLAGGMAWFATSVGAPRRLVWLAVAASLSPYLVQQTVFEIRADVLAAGLDLAGLGTAVSLWREPSRRSTLAATAWFTLAFSTKVTSLAVPASVGIALLLTGRWRGAFRFGLSMLLGVAVFLGICQAATQGRALESWRACMFAGISERQTTQTVFSGDFLELIGFSHLVVVLFVAVGASLAAAALFRDHRPSAPSDAGGAARGRVTSIVPVCVFAGVTLGTALTLSSPGTVASNHAVEWIVMSFGVLVWTAAARPRLRSAVTAALCLFIVWMSGQDIARAVQAGRAGASAVAAAERVGALLEEARSPVLSESALWPILAGRRPFLLDPFALRVVMRSRPDIADDFDARIRAQQFSLVILRMNPSSPPAQGWYANVHFGARATSSILTYYRLERQAADDAWVFVPKEAHGR